MGAKTVLNSSVHSEIELIKNPYVLYLNKKYIHSLAFELNFSTVKLFSTSNMTYDAYSGQLKEDHINNY